MSGLFRVSLEDCRCCAVIDSPATTPGKPFAKRGFVVAALYTAFQRQEAVSPPLVVQLRGAESAAYSLLTPAKYSSGDRESRRFTSYRVVIFDQTPQRLF